MKLKTSSRYSFAYIWRKITNSVFCYDNLCPRYLLNNHNVTRFSKFIFAIFYLIFLPSVVLIFARYHVLKARKTYYQIKMAKCYGIVSTWVVIHNKKASSFIGLLKLTFMWKTCYKNSFTELIRKIIRFTHATFNSMKVA